MVDPIDELLGMGHVQIDETVVIGMDELNFSAMPTQEQPVDAVGVALDQDLTSPSTQPLEVQAGQAVEIQAMPGPYYLASDGSSTAPSVAAPESDLNSEGSYDEDPMADIVFDNYVPEVPSPDDDDTDFATPGVPLESGIYIWPDTPEVGSMEYIEYALNAGYQIDMELPELKDSFYDLYQ